MDMPIQDSTVNQDQAEAEKIVLAGMKIMYDKNVFPKFIAGFKQGDISLSDMLASQAAGLIKIIDDQSKGSIPKKIIVPAATMLMIEMVDFLTKAKMAKPTKQDISDALKKLTMIILKVYSDQAKQGAQTGQTPPPGGNPDALSEGAMRAAQAQPRGLIGANMGRM
ncbi:MAG: hypothetical protein WC073_11430 [Sterolibacterium sp.]